MSITSVKVNVRIMSPLDNTVWSEEEWIISGGYATPHTAIDAVLGETRGLINREMRREQVQ